MRQQRIAVLGPGAVGGLLAARLAGTPVIPPLNGSDHVRLIRSVHPDARVAAAQSPATVPAVDEISGHAGGDG